MINRYEIREQEERKQEEDQQEEEQRLSIRSPATLCWGGHPPKMPGANDSIAYLEKPRILDHDGGDEKLLQDPGTAHNPRCGGRGPEEEEDCGETSSRSPNTPISGTDERKEAKTLHQNQC